VITRLEIRTTQNQESQLQASYIVKQILVSAIKYVEEMGIIMSGN
jgi:hypothetical protein